MKAVLVITILFYIDVTGASIIYFPRHPSLSGCYDDEFGFGRMAGGETRDLSPDHCGSIDCYKDGTIVFTGCGSVATGNPDYCEIAPGDKNKTYPNCCPAEKCGFIL